MKPGYGPFKKALVGNQHRLPEHLKQAIKNAPAKLTDKPTDKNRKTVGRQGSDVVLDEKDSTERRKSLTTRGNQRENFERVTQTVEKGQSASNKAKTRKALEQGNTDEAARLETMNYRQGGGRLGQKTYERQQGQKGKYTMTDSRVFGTASEGGRPKYRTLGDGSQVLVEQAQGNKIKKRGIQSPRIKKTDISTDLKAKAPRKKVKKVNEIKKAGVMKRGVKGLAKKAAPKKYGCKKK